MILKQDCQIAGTSLEPLLPLYRCYKGTRLIAETNGKNVKDWIIRSQFSLRKWFNEYKVVEFSILLNSKMYSTFDRNVKEYCKMFT